MELSVVIPAYNAEETLEKSVDSVEAALCQLPGGAQNAEVLLIDDGSLDNTAERARALIRKYGNILLIRQENAGVSAARNCGLERASGTWVSFVDADDTVHPLCFSRFSSALERPSDTDFWVLRSFAGDKERYGWEGLFEAGRDYSREDLMRKGYLRGSICGCIFRRAFLNRNGILFPQGVRLSEDTVFFGICLARAHCIRFLDIPFYQVFARPDSASRQWRDSQLADVGKAIQSARRLIPQEAVRHYVVFKLIIHLTSQAVDGSIPSHRAFGEAHLEHVLPLPLDGIHTERWKIRLLNRSYPLFYQLIRLRNKRKHLSLQE